MKNVIGRLCFFLSLTASSLAAGKSSEPAPDPETVYATYHFPPGKEAAFLQAVKSQWRILRTMKLVTAAPHLLFQGCDEKGVVFYAELFTWVSASTPDHAPADVRTIWNEMNQICQMGDRRSGIEITEVKLLDTDD